ncbi:MAG: ASCH domain-containing protein [Gaiellaceae bacterium]
METIDGLPLAEFGYPGRLRDELVAAVLRGEKTAGASLRAEYRPDGEDELPRVGEQAVVVDSERRPVAVIEMTEVRVVPLREVDEQFARDEGEGFESVADWRAAHERFWGPTPERETAGDPAWPIDDDTLVVCERFRLVRLLGSR